MSLETEIYSRLSGYANLTAIVGTKIYPLLLPQEVALPAVTYFKVSDIPVHAMGSDADIKTARFQISCWAEKYEEVKSVEVQVKAALSRYRSAFFKDIFWENSNDLYEAGTYHVPVDFMIFYA